MVVVLGLVAPVDCGCHVDLHGGEAFHPVFGHPHPSAPKETAGLAAKPSSGPSVQAAVPLDSGAPAATVGQVLPGGPRIAMPIRSVGVPSATLGEPLNRSIPPPDPPPELV